MIIKVSTVISVRRIIQLDEAITIKTTAEKTSLRPSGFRTCSVLALSLYELTLDCICALWLWSLMGLQVGIGCRWLIPVPALCLVKEKKTAPGGQGSRYTESGCSSSMFAKVSVTCFLLHFGAMLINLGSPFLCYITPKLQSVVSALSYWWVLLNLLMTVECLSSLRNFFANESQ